MSFQFRRMSSLVIIAMLLLAACAGPSASVAPTPLPEQEPTSVPATAPAAATPVPPPTSGIPTEGAVPATAIPATKPPIAAATATPAPVKSDQLPATVDGQVVLQLRAGAEANQIGISDDGSNVVGPRSFRIGADGTIRLLDNVNKRILFFGQNGKLTRTLRLDETQGPIDFIVNNAGEVFVYGFSSDGAPSSQVLRYGPDGKVTARLPVSLGVSIRADGIMLTAAQDLLLVQGNQTFWTLLRQGVTVDPKIQPLTEQEGAATPRSPVIFRTTPGENGMIRLHAIGLNAGISGENIMEVGGATTSLPADARFFNVDRAMSLYFTRPSAEDNAVDVWRVAPDGTVDGGAHIVTGSCGTSWRNFYVDQAGAAWTMCVDAQGAVVTRYTLQDTSGQPLPEAATAAADVAWKPGAILTAA
jgi:hypothetical protein